MADANARQGAPKPAAATSPYGIHACRGIAGPGRITMPGIIVWSSAEALAFENFVILHNRGVKRTGRRSPRV
jgi:hypothetical protein